MTYISALRSQGNRIGEHMGEDKGTKHGFTKMKCVDNLGMDMIFKSFEGCMNRWLWVLERML
jgi:hypothetical protein